MEDRKYVLSRRQVLRGFGAGVGALVLASCGAAAPTTAPEMEEEGDEEPKEAPPSGEVVTVTFWRTGLPAGPADLVEEWDTFYGETLPGMLGESISVDIVEQPWDGFLTKVQAGVTSGNPPDVTLCDQTWVPPLLAIEALLPMDEDLIDVATAYDPIVGEIYRFGPDKRFYTLPIGWWERGVFYNAGLLAEKGLTKDDLPRSLKDLIPFVQDLTEWSSGADEPEVAGMPLGGGTTFDMWTTMIDNFGAFWWLDDETANFNAPEWIEAWQFTIDAFDKYKFDARHGTDAIERFLAGRAYFLPQQLWVGRMLRADHPDIEWGQMVMPTPDGGPPYGWKEGHFGWGVTSAGNDAQVAAAWQLFKGINSPEWSFINAQGLNYVPARVEAQGKPPLTADNPHYAGVVEKHKPGNSVNPGYWTTEMAKTTNDAWEQVYDQNVPVAEALNAAKQSADALLARSPEIKETILTKVDYEAHPNWSDGKIPKTPWWDGVRESYLA